MQRAFVSAVIQEDIVYSVVHSNTERIIRDVYQTKGMDVSRPVMYPDKIRTNLMVLSGSDGRNPKLVSVYETDIEGWTWTIDDEPETESSVLVFHGEELASVYEMPSVAIKAIAEENARKWERQDPDSRDRIKNKFRRIWPDQVDDWLTAEYRLSAV